MIVFIIYTLIVKLVDVQAIGPEGSEVGLASMNEWFHKLTGVNWGLYHVTDWLSVIVFAIMAVFAVMGLVEWIKRKKLLKVDKEILALGIFYVLVFAAYAVFEVIKLNYRPVLIDGVLEASYPSSTTVLAVTVLGSAMMVVPKYLKGAGEKISVGLMGLLMGFLVVGRLVSGVHWLSDIIGGLILSVWLIAMFIVIRRFLAKKLQ